MCGRRLALLAGRRAPLLLLAREVPVLEVDLRRSVDAREHALEAHGEVRERGKHDELIQQGGIYARLHQLNYSGTGGRE